MSDFAAMRHANAARALVAAHYPEVRMKSAPYKSERHQALAVDEPRASWLHPSPSSCTGNCNQGRACDCVADVEGDEPAPLSITPAIVLVFACILFVGFGPMVLGWLKAVLS